MSSYPVLLYTYVDVVTIVSSPAGIPVSGSTNTFDYSILSNVTLTCMVNPLPQLSASYTWNTAQCYQHNAYSGMCFAHNQRTQSITGTDLTAEDAGTITCTATINGMEYTSGPFTLRITGKIICHTYILNMYMIYV